MFIFPPPPCAGNSVKLVHKGTCPKEFMIMPKDQNDNNDNNNNNNDDSTRNNSATFLHAVRAMHFYNDAKEPIPGNRVILFRAFDGQNHSPVAKGKRGKRGLSVRLCGHPHFR